MNILLKGTIYQSGEREHQCEKGTGDEGAKMPMDTSKKLQGSMAEKEENVIHVAKRTPVTALWHNSKGTFCSTIAGLTCRGPPRENELCMGSFLIPTFLQYLSGVAHIGRPHLPASLCFLLSTETNLYSCAGVARH